MKREPLFFFKKAWANIGADALSEDERWEDRFQRKLEKEISRLKVEAGLSGEVSVDELAGIEVKP